MSDSNHQLNGASDTRRDFIKKSATSAAVVASASAITPIYGQNQAPSANVNGANNRLNVAFVGVGGQGMAHVRSVKRNAADNNVALLAACDVSKTRAAEAASYIGDGAKAYGEHEEITSRDDIDVVFVSTVDHWHAPISIDAMRGGKHVYCEKPMTRYLGEAFDMYDVSKETGKKVQVGAQRTTSGAYHKAAQLNRDGQIGRLVLATGSYMRNNPKGEWNYDIPSYATKEDIEWDRWLGEVADKRDFDADHWRRWRKYYQYCGGVLGDLLPHRLHPLMLATGEPEFPTRVVSLGNSSFNTDEEFGGDTYPRSVDENVQLLAEFPSGMNILLTSGTVNEQGLTESIRGQMGTMYLGNGEVRVNPERPFADYYDPMEFSNIEPGESISFHEKNLFDAIRNDVEPSAGIDLAIRVQTVVSLAEMSDRLNLMCVFDPISRKITTGKGYDVEALTYGTLDLS